MHAEETQPNSSPTLPLRPSAGSEVPSFQATTAGKRSGFRLPLWLLTLGAGLAAGLISWAGGEAMFNMFPIEAAIIYPANYKQVSGYAKMELKATLEVQARAVVERKKAAVSFGLLGLSLGVCLGLAGGLAADSARTAVSGAVGGGIAGAVVGGGLSYAIVPLFFRYFDPEQGLLILFFTHAAIFAGLGAAAGLGLGLGFEDRSRLSGSVFGGMFGALIGTVAFETANSLAFPLMRTYEPISSEWLPRLLVYLCVAAGTALMAGLAVGGSSRKPAPAPVG
jgi:hypothetical protein